MGFFIRRMCQSGIRQFINMIEFLSAKRHWRLILDNDGLWMRLRHRSSPHRVLLLIMKVESFCVEHFILRDIGKDGSST